MQSSRASAERCRGGPRPRGFPRRRWGDVIARPDAIACRGELSGCVRALCLLAVAARGRGAGAEPVARQECAVSPIAPAIAPIPRSCANSARSGGRKGRCSGQERGRAVPGHECCCAHLHPACWGKVRVCGTKCPRFTIVVHSLPPVTLGAESGEGADFAVTRYDL